MFPSRKLPAVLPAALLLTLVFSLLLPAHDDDIHLLVFTKTAGYRHLSIPAAQAALTSLAPANNFVIDFTEDSTDFNAVNLAQYDTVVFLLTTGPVLDAAEQTAFENYIAAGGGYVGVHSASDTEYSWPWYGGLVGAYSAGHSSVQQATVKVLDWAHPSSSHLPKRWVRTDEWYNFDHNPRGEVHTLMTVDEDTYTGGTMGYDHPITWCHEYSGGRSWYTGMGHTSASYSEPEFRQMLVEGIKWAAHRTEGNAAATVSSSYQKTGLHVVSSPMELEVAPDGRVFFIERSGRLRYYDPATGSAPFAGIFPVYSGQEDGLLGLALDPNFATNNWLYMLYSPDGVIEKQRLSRFTMVGNTLDLASEIVMLEYPTQRSQCCHSAGSLEFGPGGVLYISTGDNSSPFDSAGFTPIDERPARQPWDAQRSSGNTQDLRGKILRIVPQPDGTYTIPTGNLFPVGSPDGRPEIFVMGARNPFRISVDPITGWLYFGDVGPDAALPSATRGPVGYDEVNQVRAAGNYGWPYFSGANEPYIDYNFDTGVSGSAFNPLAPVNDSPNNTGALNLPPAQGAWFWYPYGASTDFPGIPAGSARAGMVGPVYQYNTATSSSEAIPEYFDKTLFFMEWERDFILEVKVDENGDLLHMTTFAPDIDFQHPIDMAFGPDGDMYILELARDSDPAMISKVHYNTGNILPVAVASATPSSGALPLNVTFSSAGSYDPDPGDTISYEWDFELDGTVDSTAASPSHIYPTAGNFTAQLRVTDSNGGSVTATVPISAGNEAPVVTITTPPEGGFYDNGDTITFGAQVVDLEDGLTPAGGIDCADIVIEPVLGHNDHGHGLALLSGCSGVFSAQSDHAAGDNTFFILDARYTDTGAPGVNPALGADRVVLQPKIRMAQYFSDSDGVTTEATADAAGGVEDVAFIDDGNWISFPPMNLLNIQQIDVRIAPLPNGGTIEVRADSIGGPLVATIAVTPGGNPALYQDFSAPVTDPGGTHELFFLFKDTPGATDLFKLNWIVFRGPGITLQPDRPEIQRIESSTGTGIVEIFFDRTMRRSTLENLSHYFLDGGLVATSATASADQFSVELAVTGLTADTAYHLTLFGVEDLAGDPIAAGTSLPFETGTVVPPYTHFAGYQVFHFGSTSAPGAGAGEDIDGDGLDTFAEYASGTDPMIADADAAGHNASIVFDTPSNTIVFSYARAAADIVYELEWSPTLLPMTWTTTGVSAESFNPATGLFERTLTVPALTSSVYVRLAFRSAP